MVCSTYDVVETRAKKKIQPSDIEACIFQNARAKVNALEIVHVLFNAQQIGFREQIKTPFLNESEGKLQRRGDIVQRFKNICSRH